MQDDAGCLANMCEPRRMSRSPAKKNVARHVRVSREKAVMRAVNGARGGGYACDSSYAYHCARVLLDESSVRFLAEADADAPAFEERFAAYESWLAREDAPVGGAPAFVV